jgi:hypothetical protein
VWVIPAAVVPNLTWPTVVGPEAAAAKAVKIKWDIVFYIDN